MCTYYLFPCPRLSSCNLLPVLLCVSSPQSCQLTCLPVTYPSRSGALIFGDMGCNVQIMQKPTASHSLTFSACQADGLHDAL